MSLCSRCSAQIVRPGNAGTTWEDPERRHLGADQCHEQSSVPSSSALTLTTMSILSSHHTRSPSRISRRSSGSPKSARSPSPPSQTYHPSILPRSVPTPALVESVAGGAHYAGGRVDPDSTLKHRRSNSQRHHTELKHDHRRVLEDLSELYCCRPTVEIFERSWHKDAVFEVGLPIFLGLLVSNLRLGSSFSL